MSDYNGFEHLRRSLFWSRHEVISMLTAYFDESGTHKQSPAIAISGYIASVEEWERFDGAWTAMLRDERLSMMHWTDLENRKGAFKGWTKERQLALQNRAIAIIRETVRCGFSTAVLVNDYYLIAQGSPETAHQGACAFAFADNLKLVGMWIEANSISEPINYVIEHGGGYGGELQPALHHIPLAELRTQFRVSSLKSISYAEKKDVSPLQAADILAYESYKYVINGRVDGAKRLPTREPLNALLLSPHASHFYDAKNLLNVIDGLQEEGRLGDMPHLKDLQLRPIE